MIGTVILTAWAMGSVELPGGGIWFNHCRINGSSQSDCTSGISLYMGRFGNVWLEICGTMSRP